MQTPEHNHRKICNLDMVALVDNIKLVGVNY